VNDGGGIHVMVVGIVVGRGDEAERVWFCEMFDLVGLCKCCVVWFRRFVT
jgi:hypothetical protein